MPPDWHRQNNNLSYADDVDTMTRSQQEIHNGIPSPREVASSTRLTGGHCADKTRIMEEVSRDGTDQRYVGTDQWHVGMDQMHVGTDQWHVGTDQRYVGTEVL